MWTLHDRPIDGVEEQHVRGRRSYADMALPGQGYDIVFEIRRRSPCGIILLLQERYAYSHRFVDTEPMELYSAAKSKLLKASLNVSTSFSSSGCV